MQTQAERRKAEFKQIGIDVRTGISALSDEIDRALADCALCPPPTLAEAVPAVMGIGRHAQRVEAQRARRADILLHLPVQIDS